MRRPIFLAVLTFLLLVLQNQGLVHPFGHLDLRLPRPDQAEVALPHAVAACAECALLAGAASTLNGNPRALQVHASVTQPAWLAFRSRAADVPAYFSSRAPPVLL
jgi:hypothetical protein